MMSKPMALNRLVRASGVLRSSGPRSLGQSKRKAQHLTPKFLNSDSADPFLPLEEWEQRHKNPSPEQMLTLAIFLQALTDLTSDDAALSASAREWIEDNDSKALFSFINCCTTFGIDVAAAREAINDQRSPYLWDTPRRYAANIVRPNKLN